MTPDKIAAGNPDQQNRDVQPAAGSGLCPVDSSGEALAKLEAVERRWMAVPELGR